MSAQMPPLKSQATRVGCLTATPCQSPPKATPTYAAFNRLIKSSETKKLQDLLVQSIAQPRAGFVKPWARTRRR